MNARKKQHNAWDRELKQEWHERGQNGCEFRYEGCMGTFGQALAHSRKRRYITSKEQYWEVGLACVQCHKKLDEQMSHEEMESEVKRIINER